MDFSGNISPAAYVIQVFGGVRATARAVGRTPSSVCKWPKPSDEGGRGGSIPQKVHRKILEIAKERSLDITPMDLIYGRPAGQGPEGEPEPESNSKDQ